MKKILTTLALLVATTILLAQVPQKFSYQGVIRDAAGNLVRNAPVGVRVSLLKNSTEGVAVYCETHRQSTNANGLLTLTIGDGTVVGGDMATIDWADGPYFLKTETDITGGSNYTLVGAQQLLSVPYALYAGSTTNAFSGDYNDLSNKPEIPVVPDKVSAFENDAKYLTKVDLAGQLAEMQKQLDSLKAATGNSYSIENDGKPCQGVDTVTDIDGNKYPTVQIGKQCWMAENLRTTHYSSGEKCNYQGSGNYLYYEHPAHVILFGLCPNGWHVPYTSEWQQFIQYVSNHYGCDQQNLTAKAIASRDGWRTSDSDFAIGNNPETNNSCGFNARPNGMMQRPNSSTSSYLVYYSGESAIFVALAHDDQYAHYFFKLLNSNSRNIFVENDGTSVTGYFSVRCIKD